VYNRAGEGNRRLDDPSDHLGDQVQRIGVGWPGDDTGGRECPVHSKAKGPRDHNREDQQQQQLILAALFPSFKFFF